MKAKGKLKKALQIVEKTAQRILTKLDGCNTYDELVKLEADSDTLLANAEDVQFLIEELDDETDDGVEDDE